VTGTNPDVAEETYLRDCRVRQICPFCKKALGSDKRFGTGSFKDGVFCSFDCVARYRESEIKQKLRSLK